MSYTHAPYAKENPPETLSSFSPLFARILANRGFLDEASARSFMYPRYEDMHDPFLMNDMDKAIDRIYKAIKENQKIIVYADYDCDGIPGATVLNDLFKKIGYANMRVYIPHRHDEGYGLNSDAINEFIKDKVDLIVTVDLGSTDIKEIALAQKNGIDVIVTDHHELPPVLPTPFALVNPKAGEYPERMLCGAGVAFKVVQAFLARHGEEFAIPIGWEKWSLDMAGLGTMADMVPLTGENRIIAYYGLLVLQKSRRPGFRELLRKMKIDQAHLTEDDIGFMIAPRINAASRMDIPYRAFELLSTDDLVQARTLADHLSKLNDDRKSQVATIMREIHKKLEERENKPVIVIGSPLWNAGVLGLVAGKIADEHEKPVFVWGGETEEGYKGSCRSGGSVSVVDIMHGTNDVFLGFGGHEHAGGFSVSKEKVVLLEEELIRSFELLPLKEKNQIGHVVDIEIPCDSFDPKVFKDIAKLAPFGIGNHKPLIALTDSQIKSTKHFGKEMNHFELTLDIQHKPFKAIRFFGGASSFATKPEEGKNAHILITLEESFFTRRPEIRSRIIEIF